MNIGIVDIGTNTVLLLIARIEDRALTALYNEQRIPRLGVGVDASRTLLPERIEAVVQILHEYKTTMEKYGVERMVVAGTSAVRDAANRSYLQQRVFDRTGLTLEVLSGEEEALWTFRGAICGMKIATGAAVIDIGGGSTEITTGTLEEITSTQSIDVGSVRVTEKFFRHDPPTQEEIKKASEFIASSLADASFNEDMHWIGVAGTATSLAILDQGLPEFRLDAVAGYHLRAQRVEALLHRFLSLPTNKIENLSAVMKDRADIITAGTLMLHTAMKLWEIQSLTVSERGLRYGLALREFEK